MRTCGVERGSVTPRAGFWLKFRHVPYQAVASVQGSWIVYAVTLKGLRWRNGHSLLDRQSIHV